MSAAPEIREIADAGSTLDKSCFSGLTMETLFDIVCLNVDEGGDLATLNAAVSAQNKVEEIVDRTNL